MFFSDDPLCAILLHPYVQFEEASSGSLLTAGPACVWWEIEFRSASAAKSDIKPNGLRWMSSC